MQDHLQKQHKEQSTRPALIQRLFFSRVFLKEQDKSHPICRVHHIRHTYLRSIYSKSYLFQFFKKIKRPICIIVILSSFCLSVSICSLQTYAIAPPTDAKGKNVVKPEKTCPKGKYLNPKTNRCKKFEDQKVKTCPSGYRLNYQTYRCNKIRQEKGKKPKNPQSNKQNPKTPKVCSSGFVLNPATKRCNKIKTSLQNPKTCKVGYYFNHNTKRCNKETNPKAPKTCPTGFFLNPTSQRCKKETISSEKKPCSKDQVRNPKTGRCHKLTSTTAPKVCPSGKFLNPETNRCKKIEDNNKDNKPCKEGYERNPETNRCRKIHQNTGADNSIDVPKLGDTKNNKDNKKDFTGTTAIAGSAIVGIGIAIFQFKNEIFVIIRKFFLHK